MKKIILAAMIMALVFTAAGISQSQAAELGGKIGYVDLAHVFDEYLKTKEFDKALEAKGAMKQTEREKMVAEVKKMREESELLSAKAKEDKQVVVDEKIKTLQDFDRLTRDSLRKERDVMVRDILKEIEGVIQNFGKAQGYSFIFNDRVLVYKSEGNDLTAQVIKTLNDAYTTTPNKK